jgi:hypothetical protein
MKTARTTASFVVLTLLFSTATCLADGFPPELKTKGEAKLTQLKALSTDPQIVSAVKAYDTDPPAYAKAMTNDKWKSLSVLDPDVRAYSKNPLAEYLKTKKDDAVAEMFVSGADGGKVAFLSKTTSWTHKDKPKHEVPMSGNVWIGPVEVDESSGQSELQVALPVLEGGKPIGSIVVGLRTANLQ